MQLEQDKTRAKAANKVALETEKEKDTAEKFYDIFEFYDIFHKKGLESLKFAWNDEAEPTRKEVTLMTENTLSVSAPAGTASRGTSM